MQLKWPMLWDLFSLFPAHAGVIPLDNSLQLCFNPFPRTRGGDPELQEWLESKDCFSPHTRG